MLTTLRLDLQHESGEVTVEKTVELPFVPFPGLYVEGTADADLDAQIDSVFYIEDEKGFLALCFPIQVAGNEEKALELARRNAWR